jgi:hypothetical protein
MKVHFLFFTLLALVIFSSCKKEKDPFERIDLKNPSYSVNCLNCRQYGENGNVYDYTSVKTSFDFSSSKALIGNGSYLLVMWEFSSGQTGDYIIDYNNLIQSGNSLSFDGTWYWGFSNNLNVQMILYSGRGSRSNVLSIDIPKPAGSNKLGSNYETEVPPSSRFIFENK